MASPVIDEPAVGVRFGVLGPLLAIDGKGTSRAVPAAKQRIVLAALLLGNGSVVSATSLAEALWGTSPPPNAPAVLRTYLARLRQALGPAGARIVGRPPGWAVELNCPEELDLAEADSLWRAARAAGTAMDWRRASSLLTRALSLWRGEPLVDVPSAVLAQREAGRLAELRLALLEARIDADLRLGRHGELVAELRGLTAAHPLREHLRVQLMLAYYRSGQQAAALEAYREARATLAGELGVEPGPELREMQQKILTAHQDLDLAAAAHGGVTLDGHRGNGAGQAIADGAVPRQLPAGARYFSGRAAELARLTEFAEEASTESNAAVSVITGMAGVGKTALAVHWARQATGLFPDGQLYVNLRGFDPAAPPMEPREAIRLLLDGLRVPPERIPAALEAQAGLYRSLLADQRIVIIADNARDPSQVRPLLPGSPGSMVVVTSRDTLTSLAAAEGASCLRLDVLPDAEAAELLVRRLSAARVAQRPDATAAIVRLCGGLPLALVIAAARASARRDVPAAWLADELADSARRLDLLDGGDSAASVRAAFSWSAGQLTGTAARMLRLLAVHPGPDITVPAAASLAGVSPDQARKDMAELTQAHLLTEHAYGRYAFHDLVRTYAAELAQADHSDADRAEAAARVLDHYLCTANNAARLLNPFNPVLRPVASAPARRGVTPERLSGHDEALTWFRAEHRVLIRAVAMAVDAALDGHAWQLPLVLDDFLDRSGYQDEREAMQEIALGSAIRAADAGGQAVTLRLLAGSRARAGEYARARALMAESIRLFRQVGDRVGEGYTYRDLGTVAERQGLFDEALALTDRAVALCRVAGHRVGQAAALTNAGWFHALLGRYAKAVELCREALAVQRQTGHRYGEAVTWGSLGYAQHRLGLFTEAVACYRRSVSMFSELGQRPMQAEMLTELGDTWDASGNRNEARRAWRQALVILDNLHYPDADLVRARLAMVTVH